MARFVHESTIPLSGAKIIVMQRLHEQRPHRPCARQGSPAAGFTSSFLLSLTRMSIGSIRVSDCTTSRAPGDLLWPDRLPVHLSPDSGPDLGSWSFAGQYQQDPAPLEGGIIKNATGFSFTRSFRRGSNSSSRVGTVPSRVVAQKEMTRILSPGRSGPSLKAAITCCRIVCMIGSTLVRPRQPLRPRTASFPGPCHFDRRQG